MPTLPRQDTTARQKRAAPEAVDNRLEQRVRIVLWEVIQVGCEIGHEIVKNEALLSDFNRVLTLG
jgi:hypothetical protein